MKVLIITSILRKLSNNSKLSIMDSAASGVVALGTGFSQATDKLLQGFDVTVGQDAEGCQHRRTRQSEMRTGHPDPDLR